MERVAVREGDRAAAKEVAKAEARAVVKAAAKGEVRVVQPSANSPGLAHALTLTHDGIIGYWKPKLSIGTEWTAPAGFAYLSEARIAQMMLGALASRLAVSASATSPSVEISVDGKVFFEISRPTLETLKEQIHWMRGYADLRVDRNSEIVAQAQDIMPFFNALAQLATPKQKAHGGSALGDASDLHTL